MRIGSRLDVCLYEHHGAVVENLTVEQLHTRSPENPYTKQLLVASLGYDRAAIDLFEDFAAPA